LKKKTKQINSNFIFENVESDFISKTEIQFSGFCLTSVVIRLMYMTDLRSYSEGKHAQV